MHPMQERLWMNQQRMQEVHRRRLYHRSSSHHTLVFQYIYIISHPLYFKQKYIIIYKSNFVISAGPCNAHVHSSTQHTCGEGENSSPPNTRCNNGTDNAAYTENYLPPPILPPPQQPTVYSHPEARGPSSFYRGPCPVLPIIVI